MNLRISRNIHLSLCLSVPSARGLSITGGIISSWIGTGKNLPISVEQIQQALGKEKIQQLSETAGMSPEDVKAKLAEHLPNIIDKLTPDGKEGDLFGMDAKSTDESTVR